MEDKRQRQTLEEMVADRAADETERQAFLEATRHVKKDLAEMIVKNTRDNADFQEQYELRQGFLKEWFAMPRGFHTAHARSELISKYRRQGLRNLDT